MRKLTVCLGREFASNRWGVNFSGPTEVFGFCLEDRFEPTMPYPGKNFEVNEIKDFIGFLQQVLEEITDEQNNLE